MSIYLTTPARTARPPPSARVVAHVKGTSLRIVHTPTLQEALKVVDLWKAGFFQSVPGRKIEFAGEPA